MAYELPRTVLGRTGLEVTRLGIGGAYCESVEGYRQALDCGVNYIDTARAYRGGEDEKIIGQAIATQRQALVLASKTSKRDGDGARRDLETSLDLLGTECIDLYQLHHLNTAAERQQALAPNGALEALQKAREEGLLRYIGVTGHDWPQIQQAVATGHFDTVLCWYNCAMPEPENTVFVAAQAHQTGIVIMNAGRNDRLFTPPDAPAPELFYRYVLSHPAVHLTVMGLRDVARFRHVAAALAESTDIDPNQKTILEKHGTALRTAGALD